MFVVLGGTAFGKTDHGAKASLFTPRHSSSILSVVTDFGATLVSLVVSGQSWQLSDDVLGFSRAEDYEAHASNCFGSTVGSFGNRMARGSFTPGDHR
jgi:aldose 1-epimerase